MFVAECFICITLEQEFSSFAFERLEKRGQVENYMNRITSLIESNVSEAIF